MKNQSNVNWVKNNNWGTPEYLLKYIKEEFFEWNDFYDPCPYDPDFKIDWTKTEWGNYTFCNPPYTPKEKSNFVKKCFEEYEKWKIIVLLIPASTETQIFHKYIYPYAQVFLLEKRIKFYWYNVNWDFVTDKTGQSWSALCIFDSNKLNIIKPLPFKEYSKYE